MIINSLITATLLIWYGSFSLPLTFFSLLPFLSPSFPLSLPLSFFLSSQNEHLEISLRDKTEELTRAKQLHNDEIAHLMDEMRTLRANYEQKIKEYEELFDLRIQLEQEIATLSALLQEEEIR